MNKIERAIEILNNCYKTVSMCLTSDDCDEHNKAIDLAIHALEEKQERENSQPLLTNVERNIMLCPHCRTDLMGEFVEPQEEKYCPFCSYAIDIWNDELIKEN